MQVNWLRKYRYTRFQREFKVHAFSAVMAELGENKQWYRLRPKMAYIASFENTWTISLHEIAVLGRNSPLGKIVYFSNNWSDMVNNMKW